MEVGSLKPVLEPIPSQLPENGAAKVGEMTKVEGVQVPEAKAMQVAKENKEKSEEDLKEAVDKLNKTAVIFDRSLRFQIHEKTHRTMVSVVDTVADKVIRQIPLEEVLDLVGKMEDYMGMIFDKKA